MNSTVERFARGALGGLAGTLALQGMRMASDRFLPQSMPPMNESPDTYVVDEIERHLPNSVRSSVPPLAEKVAGGILATTYGIIGGSICGVLGRRGWPTAARGATLGVFTWACGYLGWMPRLGLMPSIKKQTPAQIAGPIVRHILYGIVTAEISELLRPKPIPRAKSRRRRR